MPSCNQHSNEIMRDLFANKRIISDDIVVTNGFSGLVDIPPRADGAIIQVQGNEIEWNLTINDERGFWNSYGSIIYLETAEELKKFGFQAKERGQDAQIYITYYFNFSNKKFI